MTLQPARHQIEIFVDAVMRYAAPAGFVSMRAFFEDSDQAFRIEPVALSGGLPRLIEAAIEMAGAAAREPRPVVFCPPVAAFKDKTAGEADLIEGYVLSVECDEFAREALDKLQPILGPPTV